VLVPSGICAKCESVICCSNGGEFKKKKKKRSYRRSHAPGAGNRTPFLRVTSKQEIDSEGVPYTTVAHSHFFKPQYINLNPSVNLSMGPKFRRSDCTSICIYDGGSESFRAILKNLIIPTHQILGKKKLLYDPCTSAVIELLPTDILLILFTNTDHI
jgi:hypothetical protein